MTMANMTKEGFLKLQNELKTLKETKKPAAIERLQKARAMGDLSENSEYVAAKEALTFIEQKIHEIEEVLKNVQVAEEPKNNDKVSLGSTVAVQNNDQQEEFRIVGEYETDPLNKKISPTSPIGKNLMGKKIGDVVEINVPAGKVSYKILKIS